MPIETLLRKNFWAVPLPLVALAALFAAQGVTQLVGTTLGPDEKMLAQAPPGSNRQVAAVTSARVPSARPILERNPFDHVTGSLLPQASAEESGGETSETVDTTDPWNAPTCDGVNVTAIAASGDEDWSLASISGSDNKARLVRRGGEVGDKTVHYIGRDRVWLSGGGALCQVRLFDAQQPAPAPAPVASAAPTTSPRSRAGALDPELRKGIQAVSATEFNVDRGVVDKILENQADLMRQARVVPVQENGRVVGISLNGIRPDALLGVLGMQNGDQLRTINGFEMGSPEKALEAYARLRTADKLTIQLNRGGKNINLDYNIK